MDKHRLLARLDEIGRALSDSGHGLALIGLGSAGAELPRLDQYSDLDFFAIVEPGYKQSYVENLEWLSDVCPIAYHFRNTDDGHKLLFAVGTFCEFAVFERQELQKFPFAPGRVVWKRPDVSDTIGAPGMAATPPNRSRERLLGEALTNLYVGLGREKRGERLSAMRFIQFLALDRMLELAPSLETEQNVGRDLFANERRAEHRFPTLTDQFPSWLQGYEHNRESALAMLSFLERHFEVNEAIAHAIRELCK